jgi:hypothetical protein
MIENDILQYQFALWRLILQLKSIILVRRRLI